jgi:hypothetical protein
VYVLLVGSDSDADAGSGLVLILGLACSSLRGAGGGRNE